MFTTGNRIPVDPDTSWDEPFVVESMGFQQTFSNGLMNTTVRFRFGKVVEDDRSSVEWERQVFAIRVVFPSSYERGEEPEAFVDEPNIRSSKHMYSNGHLCLSYPGDGTNQGWDPAENNGVTILLWAIQWLRAYRRWKRTDRWPGASAD